MNQHYPLTRVRSLIATAFLLAPCIALQAQLGSWAPIAAYGGGGRSGAASFSIGTKAYVGTGEGTGGSYKKDFWEYDPATNAWSQKADFGGTARRFAAGFSIGAKGYLGTGAASDGRKQDFWEYDPATNTWTQKADCGGSVRVYAVGFSIAGKGYIGTGFNQFDDDTKDFWEYNPATNTWVQKADFGGTARDGAVAFAIGAKGYLGTGYDALDMTGDFWEFDPAANTWTAKAAFAGGPRYNACGFSAGGKGYLGTGNSAAGLKNDFWEYNPSTDTWALRTVFPGTARQRSTAFSIGAMGYLGLGHDGGYKADLWAFTAVPTITCSPDTTPLCTMGTAFIAVPFTSNGTFTAGNVFTVELSNATGGFASPTAIGSLAGTTVGTINCTLPTGIAAGTGYRIRVVSSAPVITGTDNGTNLVLEAGPPAVTSITAGGPVQFCEGDSVSLAVAMAPGQRVQWLRNGNVLLGATASQITAGTAGNYTVQLANACGTTESNILAVTVHALPLAQINTDGSTSFCEGGAVLLDASSADPQATYAWSLNGIAIPGADSATWLADSTGLYAVVITGGTGCVSMPSTAVAVTVHPLPPVPVITLEDDTLRIHATGLFQWYLQGNLLPAATGLFLLPQGNGDYTVTVTDTNGCASSSLPFTYLFSGLAPVQAPALSVAPNPSNGLFTLHLPQLPATGALFTVWNAAGQAVVHGQLSGTQQVVDISSQPAGIYLLQVVAAEAAWTGCVIKQ